MICVKKKYNFKEISIYSIYFVNIFMDMIIILNLQILFIEF